MPPIVPLTVGAPLVSMAPVLVKPLPPVTVYVTAFSVTPGAAVRLKPIEPGDSTSAWVVGSREQPASGPVAASARPHQRRGSLPRVGSSPELPCPCPCPCLIEL